jgi:CheY-like chemotaxis protein
VTTAERGKTLLIVEDNQIEREGLSALLQQAGYGVISAAEGKQALDRLQGRPAPDAMLLDMMMSGVDGWQILRLLRRSPELKSVPVIVITGLEIASPEWAESLGAVSLFRKPIDVPMLLEEIRQAVNS